ALQRTYPYLAEACRHLVAHFVDIRLQRVLGIRLLMLHAIIHHEHSLALKRRSQGLLVILRREFLDHPERFLDNLLLGFARSTGGSRSGRLGSCRSSGRSRLRRGLPRWWRLRHFLLARACRRRRL